MRRRKTRPNEPQNTKNIENNRVLPNLEYDIETTIEKDVSIF